MGIHTKEGYKATPKIEDDASGNVSVQQHLVTARHRSPAASRHGASGGDVLNAFRRSRVIMKFTPSQPAIRRLALRSAKTSQPRTVCKARPNGPPKVAVRPTNNSFVLYFDGVCPECTQHPTGLIPICGAMVKMAIIPVPWYPASGPTNYVRSSGSVLPPRRP